jgi:hypothetical protein
MKDSDATGTIVALVTGKNVAPELLKRIGGRLS